MMRTTMNLFRALSGEPTTAAVLNETWADFDFDTSQSDDLVPTIDSTGSLASDDSNGGYSSRDVDLDASFFTTRLLITGTTALLLLLILVTLYRRLVIEKSLQSNEDQLHPPNASQDEDDLEQGKVLQKVLSHDRTVQISMSQDDDDLTSSESSSTTSSPSRSLPRASHSARVVSWPPSGAPHRLYDMDSFVQALQQDQQRHNATHAQNVAQDDESVFETGISLDEANTAPESSCSFVRHDV